MFKLLFKKTHPDVSKGRVEPVLPDIAVHTEIDFTAQAAQLDRYHAMTQWPQQFSDIVHPAYLAMRALTLQAPLIIDPKQPFAGLGLVHMGNKMHYTRMLKRSEKITLSCAFGQLWDHKLGWVFSVNTRAYAVADPDTSLLELESHYLYRQKRKPEPCHLPQYCPDKIPFMQFASQSLPLKIAATGATSQQTSEKITIDNRMARSYARLSGDYNPIHLFTWTARLFGFKQPIIHGMWTKARVLSTWFSHQKTFAVNQPCTIDVQFMRFISLPNAFSVHAVQVVKSTSDEAISQNEQGPPTTYLAGMPVAWSKDQSPAQVTQDTAGTEIEPHKPFIQVSIR